MTSFEARSGLSSWTFSTAALWYSNTPSWYFGGMWLSRAECSDSSGSEFSRSLNKALSPGVMEPSLVVCGEGEASRREASERARRRAQKSEGIVDEATMRVWRGRRERERREVVEARGGQTLTRELRARARV